MKSAICDRFGIEFPLFAFSHCRDVVAEVSKAGGFGVFGASRLPPEILEEELRWIDDHVQGKPYGVDVLIPNKLENKDSSPPADALWARVPGQHKSFVADLLKKHDIDTSRLWESGEGHNVGDYLRVSGAAKLLDVAFAHPIKLIVNALGVPPAIMFEGARKKGIAVGALTGAREHAIKHAEAGVDILVVAGGEAGGHCGDVSTMVLVPEVVRAVEGYKGISVLAAGGIATGRQMAAAMAMGAAGAWCGSVWLTTTEAETNPVVKEKMLAAGSRNTSRSRSRTGKYTRQLQSAWTDAWSAPGSPDPLPMPLQGMLAEPAMREVGRLAILGHRGAKELASYYVGQAVGLMDKEQTVRSVVYDFKADFAEAVERLSRTLED
jgi:NAD(P)H-dependent flavin oxidoreductase YrpB (nitropropane dioxygenase family)